MDLVEKYLGKRNDFLLEGKEEAKVIRDALKKQFGLTNRDVAVKARSGSTSSSVRVVLKTPKALPYMQKIKDIGRSQEWFQTDQVTQTILAGGNTFVFTELDWKFRDKLVKKIHSEITKKVTDEFENGEGGGNSIKLYGGDYIVYKDRQAQARGRTEYRVIHSKQASAGPEQYDLLSAAGRVLSMMLEFEDAKNLKKLG